MPMLQHFEVFVTIKIKIDAATVIDSTGKYPAASNAARTALNLIDPQDGTVTEVQVIHTP
jgi:hypothetical protein